MAVTKEQLIGGRFKSIEIGQLEALLELYAEKRHEDTGLKIFRGGEIWSNDLANHFRQKKIWPPFHHKEKFSPNPPDVVVTYMWNGTALSELPKLIKARFTKMGRSHQFTVWIDCWFNDQRDEDRLRDSVKNANAIYRDAPDHVVVMSLGCYDEVACLPWDRCWCINELAIRDQIAVQSFGANPSIIIISAEVSKQVLSRLKSLIDCPNHDFLAEMKGHRDAAKKIDDPKAIKDNLIPSFYESASDFNKAFFAKLKDILANSTVLFESFHFLLKQIPTAI